MPRLIEPEALATYFEQRRTGQSIAGSARAAGISVSSASRIENGKNPSKDLRPLLEDRGIGHDERYLASLSPEAQRALADFAYFRQRYFGRAAMPWATDLAKSLVTILTSTNSSDPFNKHYVVANVSPSSGKTSLMRDVCVWLICRNRSVRILWGSRTETQAKKNVQLLRDILAHPGVLTISDEQRRTRGSVDPEGSLVKDFGRFAPDKHGGTWTASGFTVVNPGVQGLDKERTMSAYGMDSGFLGDRVDIAIWDDLVDIKNYRVGDTMAKTIEWWDQQAEKRIEPGGLNLLIGQRLSSGDLYKHNLEKVTLPVDADGEIIPGAEPIPKYTHIRYVAHDVSRCTEQHSPTKAKPWPEGCLLDPKALTWRELSSVQLNNPTEYAVVYQQEDGDMGAVLVDPAWIYGGEDNSGVTHLGCVDRERVLGQYPTIPNGHKVINLGSIDPSGVQKWGILRCAWDTAEDIIHIVDLFNGSMTASQILDRDQSLMGYSGLMEDWQQTSHADGHRITHWIFEQNTTQRWFTQYNHARDWQRARSVNVLGHSTTGGNKLDEHRGVEMLRDYFRYGRVRIPYGDERTRLAVKGLIAEATKYPNYPTSDLLMALWFVSYNAPRLSPAQRKQPVRQRPTWLRTVA